MKNFARVLRLPDWPRLLGPLALVCRAVWQSRLKLRRIPAGMSLTTYFAERQRIAADLRIAAIAFECQEGIVVMNSHSAILRVNKAFTHLSGYTAQEVEGKTTGFLRSDRHPPSFYAQIRVQAARTGAWQGEVWQRRKNGDSFPARVTIAAVRNALGRATHYVANITDATSRQMQEQQRLLNEAAQRRLLVSEVHHRIKNTLQGMIGILRQFAHQHPETTEPINQAIGQVQSMAVIHSLQGRVEASAVRVFELTVALAGEIQNLWHTPVAVEVPADWVPCVLVESETVPIALVLNELILNAVKHGGKAHGRVSVVLRKGRRPDRVQVSICNPGRLAAPSERSIGHHNGLLLVKALMPRDGARLSMAQQGGQVVTVLELSPPVVSLDMKEPS